MGRWIKYFIDGNKETGDDIEVKRGNASWSRGKLTGIYGVELLHNNKVLKIIGPGEYWQSDTYEAGLFDNKSVLVNRRIERQIGPMDFFYSCCYENDVLTLTMSGLTKNTLSNSKIIKLYPEQIGSWLIAELNIRNGLVKQYVSKEKI